MLWSSEEFGFCEVADAFASGSSLMPQKKNPDAAELLRAKAPRVVGRLTTLHGVLHALPLAYNKDLQEDKEQLFDAVDTLELCLRVATAMVAGTEFRPRGHGRGGGRRDARAPPTSPTCSFAAARPSARPTASSAGWCARRWPAAGALSELTAEELAELAPGLGPGHASATCCRGGGVLESKVSAGGTALARVREQLGRAPALP